MTLEAVVGTRQFVKNHGDIVAFHIEGVPRAECLEGKPFNPELVRDWEGQKQAADYEALLAFAQAQETRFVIGYLHRDYDALGAKIEATAPEAFLAWRDCGLIDEQGQPRPAYAVWKRYLDRPLVR